MKIWEDNKEVLKETLVTGSMHRGISMTIYKIVTQSKEIPEFEYMDQVEKLKIWEEARRVANGRIDKATCVEVAKAFYILDLLSSPQ